MNYSKISYEQIVMLAEQLQTASQNMETILNEVTTLFNQIGDSGVWSGTAAQLSKSQFDSLKAKFPDFYIATSKCCSHLKSVVENYKNIDASVSNI